MDFTGIIVAFLPEYDSIRLYVLFWREGGIP
jgi:hypothetical protein